MRIAAVHDSGWMGCIRGILKQRWFFRKKVTSPAINGISVPSPGVKAAFQAIRGGLQVMFPRVFISRMPRFHGFEASSSGDHRLPTVHLDFSSIQLIHCKQHLCEIHRKRSSMEKLGQPRSIPRLGKSGHVADAFVSTYYINRDKLAGEW